MAKLPPNKAEGVRTACGNGRHVGTVKEASPLPQAVLTSRTGTNFAFLLAIRVD